MDSTTMIIMSTAPRWDAEPIYDHEEEEEDPILHLQDTSILAARDVSACCEVDQDVNNTRCDVSPYNSLLNLTMSDAEDEEDVDDDDDFLVRSITPPLTASSDSTSSSSSPPPSSPPKIMTQSPPVNNESLVVPSCACAPTCSFSEAASVVTTTAAAPAIKDIDDHNLPNVLSEWVGSLFDIRHVTDNLFCSLTTTAGAEGDSFLSSTSYHCNNEDCTTSTCPGGSTTDVLFYNLCQHHGNNTSYPSSQGSGHDGDDNKNKNIPLPYYSYALEWDIWHVLGCNIPVNHHHHINTCGDVLLSWPLSISLSNDHEDSVPPSDQLASSFHSHHHPKQYHRHCNPSVHSRRARLLNMRRLRQMDNDLLSSTQPPSPTTVMLLRPSKSMDDSVIQKRHHKTMFRKEPEGFFASQSPSLFWPLFEEDALQEWIGRGTIDPIPHKKDFDDDDIIAEEEGYDSDPGDCIRMDSNRTNHNTHTVQDRYHHDHPNDNSGSDTQLSHTGSRTDDAYSHLSIPQFVQETMNYTWTLTWHPTNQNYTTFADMMTKSTTTNQPTTSESTFVRPTCVHVWLERGTLLQRNDMVVEPCWMWRQAYQPLLSSQRKLHVSTQKPFQLRLLSTFRIYPIQNEQMLDRNLYPLARASTSFVLKSCQPTDESYLFEAASPAQRDDILMRWKMVVARLASLAVMEDMTTMMKEFFTPTTTSDCLVPDY